MSAGLVAQHQQSSFATPINGGPGDATVVLGNDNATVGTYNTHDADATIHLQSSTAAVFNVTPAGVLGRKWMTSDGLRLYYDTGSVWSEIAYLNSTVPATLTSTTTPQLTIAYDGSNYVTVGVSSAGAVTLNATGASAGFTFSDPVTVNAAITTSSYVRWSGSEPGGLGASTAYADFNSGIARIFANGADASTNGRFELISRRSDDSGSVIVLVSDTAGRLTLQNVLISGLTASQAVFTDGSKNLVSNAITGTGSVVMSASPTLTGTAATSAITAAGLVTANAGATVASGQTLTLTGATVAGAPTWSSTQTMNITGNASGTAATVTGATQAAITTAANLTTIGTLVAGAVPASLVSAGAFTGNFSMSSLTLTRTVDAALILPTYASGLVTPGGLYYDGTNLKFKDGSTTRTITWT